MPPVVLERLVALVDRDSRVDYDYPLAVPIALPVEEPIDEHQLPGFSVEFDCLLEAEFLVYRDTSSAICAPAAQ